jgi:uncharacterized membrane protein YdfJ with MMPL/SSD domain
MAAYYSAGVLESLGVLIFRHRFATLGVTGLVLLLAIASLVRGGPLTGGRIEGLEADEAQALVDSVSGRRSETTFVVVFRSPDAGAPLARAPLTAAIDAVLGRLKSNPSVLSIASPTDTSSPIASSLWNQEAGAAMALVSLAGEFPEALEAYANVRKALGDTPLRVACTGKVPFTHDLNRTLEHDLLRAELVSLPIALLVLLLVFRTLTAAALPVGVGALAVLSGISVVLAISHHTEIAQYTINVCSLIGLGVAIDYSLFIVSRYREELAQGKNYEQALARALGTAGRVVLFSGFAVGTGMSGLFFFHGSYLFAMGVGGAIVILLACVFALTFLPALLAVLGPRIDAGRVLRGKPRNSEDTGWHRWALFVMRHPWATFLPTFGLLLFMGYPFLRLELVSADVRVLDRTIEARQAHELLREHFPAHAATRIEIAIEYPDAAALSPERLTALATWLDQVRTLPHVQRVESVMDAVAPLTALAALPPGSGSPAGIPQPALDAAHAVAHGSNMPTGLPSGTTMPTGLPSGMTMPTGLPSGMTMPTGLPSGMTMPTGLPSGMTMPTRLPSNAAPSTAPSLAMPHDANLQTASPAILASLLATPPAPVAALVNGAKSLFTRDNVLLVHVLSDQAPESEAARNVVRFAREHRNIGDGLALVGGQTAADLDATEFMISRAPYAAATIVGVTLLVLFFLLHSVVLPLKAVGMNFLSIAGSFGALVWLFQDGHLFVAEARPLEPSLPVLLFCIVFGLSMDYEVLMLSRMKEAHDQGMDNTVAVAEGLERSAGLITSAAAIMVTVFAAFALARVVLIQAVGVGMALAVTLDATLVRILLVPSTMRLFGELNWWAPRWLGGKPKQR